MFSKDDTSIESNKKIIARAKQMYRKEMPLLCNVSEKNFK